MFEQRSLFENEYYSPLADRVRPRTLDEFVGQEHLLGQGKALREALNNDKLSSMILWGPPGVGKTTLAKIIANVTHSDYQSLSAVTSGIKDLKDVIDLAKKNKLMGVRTVLFVDEIHRFNKLQQDAFLPDVENGTIVLIGATTENPSYEINNALLSRVNVYMLKELTEDNIYEILSNAIEDERGLGNFEIKIPKELVMDIALSASGDARNALNLLELVFQLAPRTEEGIIIDSELLSNCMSQKMYMYSKKGDEHYNYISALHKSMRCSDCNAAMYWLIRMLQGGEDPLYIARRLIRFASEDIGLADPNALQQAILAYDAARYIGVPECDVNLAQAVIYLCVAPKSNSLYESCERTKDIVKRTATEGVPYQLRNPTTKMLKDFGYGEGYQYAHEYKHGIVNMQCLPDKIKNEKLFIPSGQGWEEKVKERIEYIENIKNTMKKNGEENVKNRN